MDLHGLSFFCFIPMLLSTACFIPFETREPSCIHPVWFYAIVLVHVFILLSVTLEVAWLSISCQVGSRVFFPSAIRPCSAT